MIRRLRVPLFDMVMCVSGALDLVSPAVTDHHKRVAFIAVSLAEELGLSCGEEGDLFIAGSLHDAGALSLREKLEMLRFEIGAPHRHAELGSILLRQSALFNRVAPIVRFHHVPWSSGAGQAHRAIPVPLGSHVLHLADRVAVLIRKDTSVLGQVKAICRKVEEESGLLFNPDLVGAFLSLARREAFWLDAASPYIERMLSRRARLPIAELEDEDLLDFAKFLGKLIDFRSRFTSVHSSGVAAVAESLACHAGFSKSECFLMRIAGYLHDLGKLAIPSEILEKPGKLSDDEIHVVRAHTFHTYRILETIGELETVTQWAAFHHERLDGSGYPFHLRAEDIPYGARIMAVADVFTAITEDRPYRVGMDFPTAMAVLESMAAGASLDARVVAMLKERYDEVHTLREEVQAAAKREYEMFEEGQKVTAQG